jgi:hypothetical protein
MSFRYLIWNLITLVGIGVCVSNLTQERIPIITFSNSQQPVERNSNSAIESSRWQRDVLLLHQFRIKLVERDEDSATSTLGWRPKMLLLHQSRNLLLI